MDTVIFWLFAGLVVLYVLFRFIRARFFPDNFDHLKRQARQSFAGKEPTEGSGPEEEKSEQEEHTEPQPAQPSNPKTQLPDPLFGTKVSVQQSYLRAKKHVAEALAARREHNYQLAEEIVRKALDEVHSELRRDHWYTPEVLNALGCILYDQGRNGEARAIWEEAEQIALEWDEQCAYIMQTLQNNINLAKKRMGF